jgi:major membrane immunogen (membrane-anchored lipoprotein)
MPKKKAGSFNSVQIKDGKIVRMYKDGRIKSIIDDYLVKHTKQLIKKG